MAAARTLVLIANRAVPDPDIPLGDLPGAGGRFDVVARFLTASLLTSHNIRDDTEAILLFANAKPEPVALKARGHDAIGLRPDERSTAARLLNILDATPMPVWQDIADGFALCSITLDALLEELPAPVHWMHEDGDDLHTLSPTGGSFVLGDQDDLTPRQASTIQAHADTQCSLGPVALQADQAVTIIHNVLDRAHEDVES